MSIHGPKRRPRKRQCIGKMRASFMDRKKRSDVRYRITTHECQYIGIKRSENSKKTSKRDQVHKRQHCCSPTSKEK